MHGENTYTADYTSVFYFKATAKPCFVMGILETIFFISLKIYVKFTRVVWNFRNSIFGLPKKISKKTRI